MMTPASFENDLECAPSAVIIYSNMVLVSLELLVLLHVSILLSNDEDVPDTSKEARGHSCLLMELASSDPVVCSICTPSGVII
jgi:hypothetical protein